MASDPKPGFSLFKAVMEHGKRPHLPRLKPDKLVGVVDRSVAVETGEEAAALAVHGVILPEGDDIIEQRSAILFRQDGKALVHGILFLSRQCRDGKLDASGPYLLVWWASKIALGDRTEGFFGIAHGHVSSS